MLTLVVLNYFFLLPLLLNIFCIWRVFFNFNFKYAYIKNNWDNVASLKTGLSNINIFFFFRFILILNFFYFIYLYTFNSYSLVFWWSHFKLNNYFIYLHLLVMLFCLYFIYISSFFLKQQNIYNIDYIFSISNIVILLPILFYTNSLFTFFFFIELTSFFILYKFITTKINFNKKYYFNKNFSIFSKNFINLLFFQYWASFFSSVLLVYTLCIVHYLFNSSDWIFINFFTNINNSNNYLNSLLFIILLSGLLIKLGIAPVQLYKIEIYKSLPFITIFFYTVFYFLFYFLFFILFFNFYLSAYINISWVFIIFILIFGCLYSFSILFDTYLFKAFLAYSTILNSILFILYTLVLLF